MNLIQSPPRRFAFPYSFLELRHARERWNRPWHQPGVHGYEGLGLCGLQSIRQRRVDGLTPDSPGIPDLWNVPRVGGPKRRHSPPDFGDRRQPQGRSPREATSRRSATSTRVAWIQLESRVKAPSLFSRSLTASAHIHDLPSLRAEVSRLHGYGAGVLFRFSGQQDQKDSTQVIASAFQGGMGLPERDYYFRSDEKSQKIRDAYVKHIANMLASVGRRCRPSRGRISDRHGSGNQARAVRDEPH